MRYVLDIYREKKEERIVRAREDRLANLEATRIVAEDETVTKIVVRRKEKPGPKPFVRPKVEQQVLRSTEGRTVSPRSRKRCS